MVGDHMGILCAVIFCFFLHEKEAAIATKKATKQQYLLSAIVKNEGLNCETIAIKAVFQIFLLSNSKL